MVFFMSDKIAVSACVRSGFCCRKSPCPFGSVDESLGYCKHLSFDERDVASCLNYSEIIKDKSSSFSPAFGFGCCMSLGNSYRDEIINRDFEGKIPVVYIDNFY